MTLRLYQTLIEIYTRYSYVFLFCLLFVFVYFMHTLFAFIDRYDMQCA